MTEEAEMKAYKQKIESAQQWQKTYSSAAEIPDDKVPDNYDFRNINGVNLLTETRN